MNILVVDDHATDRKLLRIQLEAEGFAVTEAGDGVEALQVLARERIDGVVSDILMPRMDGYRLCHEIRKNEAWRRLRLILYSSTYTSPGDVQLGSTVGADQFIAKPAPGATLVAALRLAAELPDARSSELPDSAEVLDEYSAVLVRKLEEKNTELESTLAVLQNAHARIQELNAGLERRVAERTAELEARNEELAAALGEVKELSGLLPICGYCKKIRDDKNYWNSVEEYVGQRTRARFTHGICPQCLEKAMAEMEKGKPP